MSVTLQKNKYPGPEGPALDYPWKGVINISLHVVGRLEYWVENRNVAQFGNIKMPKYLMKLVAVRNPSFHHSITPLFHYSRRIIYWHSQLFLTLAMRDRHGPSEIPLRGGRPSFSRLIKNES